MDVTFDTTYNPDNDYPVAMWANDYAESNQIVDFLENRMPVESRYWFSANYVHFEKDSDRTFFLLCYKHD